MLNNRNGGFVFVEFAIALPLLILLMYGMAVVGTRIFELGKMQLADYVLEEEAHGVLSRLIYDARAAKSFTMDKNNMPTLIFVYHTINEIRKSGGTEEGDLIADKEEQRVYKLDNSKIHYKRQTSEDRHPITGDSYFGETEVTNFDFDEPEKNVLHVTLEMQIKNTSHKIKIDTAVYMPSLEDN